MGGCPDQRKPRKNKIIKNKAGDTPGLGVAQSFLGLFCVVMGIN